MAKSTAKKTSSPSSTPMAAPKNSAGASINKPSVNGNSQEMGLLEKFFIDGLKDIYWAEKALTKALPKMQKAATTQELKSAFVEHLAQTKEQVTRLESVFEIMGKKAQAKKCDAMEGLIKESEGIIEETEAGSLTRDVALIMAAQKVEHYEIATYGGLAQLAKTLGRVDAKELLGQTLQEEKDTDMLLTQIAETHINVAAEQED
ncbi:MAG: ferritin-like domain-containing protein [Chitinophagaceae bacterium]|nr:ferritin-like domain-containing protein [Chitinophagaceae bacterium]